MSHKHLILFITGLLTNSNTIFAGKASLLPQIKQKLSSLQHFKLSLTQKTFQNEQMILETKGFLLINKPDKLRLQIDNPEDEKSILVANKSEIQAYHPGLSEELPGTLTIYETQNNPAKIWFNLFEGDLTGFTVQENGNKLVLVPKESTSEVSKVEATVSDNFLFTKIHITYKSGNKAEFNFDSVDTKINIENQFSIEVPKNTKVDRIKSPNKPKKAGS